MPLQLNTITPSNWLVLVQIGQKYPSTFSFAKKEGDVVTALHPGVLCRDYLLDQLLWMKGAVKFDKPVYGFVQVPEVNPDYPEFFISERVEHLEKNLDGLHDIEKSLGLSLTEILPVEKGYYVKGDPWWFKTTLHLSWYTQALRQMGAVKIDWTDMAKSADETFKSMGRVLNQFPYILAETGYDILRSVKTDLPISIHDGSGMYTLFNYAKRYEYSYESASEHYYWTKDLYQKVKNVE